MAEPRESFLTKVGVTVVAAVIIALLVGTSSPWWVKALFPESTPSAASGASTPNPTATPRRSTAKPSQATPTSIPLVGCVLSISNPFVELHDKPGITSLVLIRVPVGDYATSDTALATFAGKQQRWFQITAQDRLGWVLDDTIFIAGKSADCP